MEMVRNKIILDDCLTEVPTPTFRIHEIRHRRRRRRSKHNNNKKDEDDPDVTMKGGVSDTQGREVEGGENAIREEKEREEKEREEKEREDTDQVTKRKVSLNTVLSSLSRHQALRGLDALVDVKKSSDDAFFFFAPTCDLQ